MLKEYFKIKKEDFNMFNFDEEFDREIFLMGRKVVLEEKIIKNYWDVKVKSEDLNGIIECKNKVV